MVWYQSRTLNVSSTSMIYSIPELLMLSKFSLMTNIRNVITSKDLPPRKRFVEGINEYVFRIFPLSPTCVRKLFLSPTKCFSVKCYKRTLKIYISLFVCISFYCCCFVIMFNTGCDISYVLIWIEEFSHQKLIVESSIILVCK